MRLSLYVIAALSLAACNGSDKTGEQTALELSCVGTGMTAATCSCLEEAAQNTLDNRLYETLVEASAEAEAARRTEGSKDGMMDRLPDDMDTADQAQISKFLQKLRSDCRGGAAG